jgi:leader peptidase (prepilin peptidase)/N-methyltransferase
VADRIGARWPAHEDGSIRRVDWRTLVVALAGAGALAVLPGRFDDPAERLLFGAYFLALVFLLATDLDQRLLPDLVTLPMIPLALVAAGLGVDPLVHGQLGLSIVAAVALPLGMYLLSIPFGAGAIGTGDLKLLVSVGLLSGLARGVIAIISAALLSGVVVLLLLGARRVTLRSYIPFGPFLIAGAFWAVLVSPG